MGAAELMLRLGCSLVAWLVLFAHCMWLAALACGDGGATPWLALLLWTPVTLVFALLLNVGFAVPGIGRALRLPALLLIPLLPLAARVVLTTLAATTLHGESICASAVFWTKVWAPAQLVMLIMIGVVAIRAWRRGAA
jgi:hypothetical protein